MVNDQTIYYTLSDFKSDAAKQDFQKLQELTNRIQELETHLNDLRHNYFIGDANQKRSLQPSILSTENQIPELLEQYENILKEARNLEIKQLNTKI